MTGASIGREQRIDAPSTWVQVEVLAGTAQAELGAVPSEALADIRRAPVPSVARIRELEAERDHEILAFLAAHTEAMPAESARWVHHGMTSYDLVDTALGLVLARSCDLVLEAARALARLLAQRALEHWDTVCIGRTHGIHAEPTTFGQKLAVHAHAVHRCLGRLADARTAVAVGTLSGPVGTYSHIHPQIEERVCAELGLGVEPMPSQVVARDRHAQLLSALAITGAVVEQFALEMRLLQRTEVAEVEEPRSRAYQGSSAMPHKRNPTTSERL
ncbi:MULTISPECIES: lyase family protein [unclassified Streptomyces]|uniref:lyase family protein n=1 Tax=unclassified Streptomyces TaxID=2593676 RepID=UPI001EF9AED0|nr:MULTISPECIES: lyase family protein [unclassified Streptomyces]